MKDGAAICLGAAVGAVLGGAFGYLYLTRRGREIREDLEPAVTDLVTELQKAWALAEPARTPLDRT